MSPDSVPWNLELLNVVWEIPINWWIHKYRDQVYLFDRFFNKRVNRGEHKPKKQTKKTPKNKLFEAFHMFFTVMSNGIHMAVNKRKILIGESLISYQVFLDGLLCDRHWARKKYIPVGLGSITMNKASGGDGIPVELFQILKDDALKVLHSICQQIWKTQQWPQD